MKRWMAAIFAMLSLLLLCACGQSAEAPSGETAQTTEATEEPTGCPHKFSAWQVVVDPTCTMEGVQIRACTLCNYEDQQVLPFTKHIFLEWFTEIEPKCNQDGLEISKCSICYSIQEAIIPSPGHDFTPWTIKKPAKLCTEGYEVRKCNACGEEETKVLPAPIAHVEVIDPAVAATCTAPGRTQGSHCSVCSSTLAAYTEIPALPHSEVIDRGYAATCTVNGKTDGKHCSVCNTVLIPQSTIIAKHKEVTTKGYAATCTADGLTDGKKCSVCQTVLTKQNTIPKLGHKYQHQFTKENHNSVCTVCSDSLSGAHTFKSGTTICSACPYFKEMPPDFGTGYVTREKTYIETEYALFEIDSNIYVRNDLAEMTDALCKAMEKVTGLSFDTPEGRDSRFLIEVTRTDDPHADNESAGRPSSISGGYFRSSRGDKCWNRISLSPNHLFLAENSYILHEMSHVLRFRQSKYGFSTVMEEGFAAFVEWKTLQYLEETNSPLAYALDTTYDHLNNIEIGYHYDIYSQPMEYWLDQDDYYFYQYGNEAYGFGIRFMSYLERTYGNYTAWFAPEIIENTDGLQVLAETEIAIIKNAYGSDSLNSFYPWLRQHYDEFMVDERMGPTWGTTSLIYDMTDFPPISPYPSFWANGKNAFLLCDWSFQYQDLYINISEAVNYLKNYKQRNTDNLRLCLSDTAIVQLFDAEGCLIAQTTDKVIPLKGVSYIKLVGKGYMGNMEMVGYYKDSVEFNKETVLLTEVLNNNNTLGGWYFNSVLSQRTVEYELLFREDITVIARLTAPCDTRTIDEGWEEHTTNNKTEILLSGQRLFWIWNRSSTPITMEIVVIPKA